MTTDARPRRRSKVLLATFSVVATLVFLEVGIRIFDAVRGRSWNARTGWYWTFEQDPFSGYRGRANVEVKYGSDGGGRHNGDGFRDDRELRHIKGIPGHRLVICVGESSTYGSGTATSAESYPARLEAHLRRLSGDSNWFVYNAGLPAYTSHQIVQILHLRLLKYRPEVVVMMNLRNDVEIMSRRVNASTDYSDLALVMAPLPKTFWSELYMRSSLVGLIATRHYQPAVNVNAKMWEIPPPTARGKSFYLDNLTLAALVCRRAPTRLMIVDQPIFNDGFHASRREAITDMRSAMKAVCRENDVPVLAANQPLRESGFKSPDEVHLGPVGYDKLAEILAPQVLEVIAPPR